MSFWFFLVNTTLIFFDFLHDYRSQFCTRSGVGVRFQKKIDVLAGLSVKKSGFWHFLGNSTMYLFDFLHDDRGQPWATSGPGVGFQKR